MRIAFLCHRIPYPPDKGEKIRAFHELRAMASVHDVDLFTLADEKTDLAGRDALLEYCRNVAVVHLNRRTAKVRSLPYVLSSIPLTVPYFYSARLAKQIGDAFQSRTYDRIFVYSSAMWQYVSGITHIPIVTDLVDVDSNKWHQYSAYASFPSSAIYAREAHFLRRYERRVCRHSAAIIVTTDREAELVQEICPDASTHAIPNGVDSVYFRPAARTRAGAPVIVFTGDMSYFPNEDAVRFFASQVLPRIQISYPDARFLIVGRNPGPRVRMLSRNPSIHVTGFVPDIREYLYDADVSVAPFRMAAGIQNKILEAMACGVPVVATPRAMQGVAGEVIGCIEEAGSAEKFAAAVAGLLADPDVRRAKGLESRRRVTAYYDWNQSLARILAILQTCGADRERRSLAG